MNNYVQLKDGVVFATLTTAGDIPESNTIIKVNLEPESLINKKYVDGSFVDAEQFKYAMLDGDTVIQINKTMYSSEITGPVIDSDLVQVLWTWDGEKFNPPSVVEPTVIVVENIIVAPEETPVETPAETPADVPLDEPVV